jgi:dTDP-4-amino-4,6-dideoxygalactose transaminase
MSKTISVVSSNPLALTGGTPLISQPMPHYSSYGPEEKLAAQRVLDSGVLSQFLGAWSPDFFGGKEVQAFEREWEQAFHVKHAISVNSATSGLICALGALDLEPGDEVIVSPWTMSADAAAILVWNAIPVFADIEPETFGLSPESVRQRISPRTKAILVSDIFGQAAQLDELLEIAREHGLTLIEDAAQAPWARYGDRFVGTVADIGIFSLNYHKHIHTGEGGVCVTNNPELAERMQLIRNHAESVVSKKGVSRIQNMLGFNFRLGEIEAAMGREQLKKLPSLAASKTRAGSKLYSGLSALPSLQVPETQPGATHVYYVFGLRPDLDTLGVSRSTLAKALRAEGVPAVSEGYVAIHLLPMFQQRQAYGTQHFPWKGLSHESLVTYEKGICPLAERYHQEVFMGLAPCSHRYDDHDVAQVVQAFEKVWSEIDSLRDWERRQPK